MNQNIKFTLKNRELFTQKKQNLPIRTYKNTMDLIPAMLLLYFMPPQRNFNSQHTHKYTIYIHTYIYKGKKIETHIFSKGSLVNKSLHNFHLTHNQ